MVEVLLQHQQQQQQRRQLESSVSVSVRSWSSVASVAFVARGVLTCWGGKTKNRRAATEGREEEEKEAGRYGASADDDGGAMSPSPEVVASRKRVSSGPAPC
uniref:Uncharacterized protein n=1 Tax=Anopheles melas TaxID=34690 RepID=A0A182U0X8_9DIPT